MVVHSSSTSFSVTDPDAANVGAAHDQMHAAQEWLPCQDCHQTGRWWPTNDRQAHSITKTLSVKKAYIMFTNPSVSNCSENGRYVSTLKSPTRRSAWKVMLFQRGICQLEREANFNARCQVLLCSGWIEGERRSHNAFYFTLFFYILIQVLTPSPPLIPSTFPQLHSLSTPRRG